MTADREKAAGSGVKCPSILSSWVVVLGALGIYGATLNHWVTFASLPFASQLTGWDWHPGPLPWRPNSQYPLFLVLTLPLRMLPVAWRPLGLNLFTAAGAAAVLGMLARSVRLAGRFAVEGERRREDRDKLTFAEGASFMSALFAVLLLAGQRTFWENAIAGTGEMLDLLVFALLILFLLEFRVSDRDGWLFGFAFVYGLGLANNWALIGFYPCFLLAFIGVIWWKRVANYNIRGEESGGEGEMVWKWIRRVVSFNWSFGWKIIGFGVLGLMFYGLIPLAGALRGDGGFWEFVREKLGEQHFLLTRIPRYFAVVAGMMTVGPLLFAAMKLPSGEGETTQGAGLTRFLTRGANLLCLAVGVLMFLDIKWSPNPRNMGLGVLPGTPGFLTFYYLAALSVGFFSGQLLRIFKSVWRGAAEGGDGEGGYERTVFGREAQRRRRGAVRFASGGTVGLLSMVAVGLPVVLIGRNLPEVRRNNGPVLAEFGGEIAKSLPDKPTIVLADDPSRLYLAMGAGQALHLPDQYLFVEAPLLIHREYRRHLADLYPVFTREITNWGELPERLTGEQAGELVARLVQHYPVYCLHPGFGEWLEHVCMTPHGLGVVLHPSPTHLLETLSLSPGALATNQNYWHVMENGPLGSLAEVAGTSSDARRVAGYYSQTLNYWGTELQKAGMHRKDAGLLEDANAQFVEAIVLNPTNLVARANQQFNAGLLGLRPVGPPGASSNAVAEWDGRWDQALRVCGPADEPSLNIRIGRHLAQHGLYRQAAGWFQRSLELAPDDPTAELDLANSYVDLGLPDAAFALIADARKRAPLENPMDLAGLEALAYVAKNDFDQADKLLSNAHSLNPHDDLFTAEMAEVYRLMGYRALNAGKGGASEGPARRKAAAVWFKKSLAAFNEHLQFLDSRPIHAQDTDAVSRRVAEMQKLLTNN